MGFQAAASVFEAATLNWHGLSPGSPPAVTHRLPSLDKFATSRRSGTLGCGFGFGLGAPGATTPDGWKKIMEQAPGKVNVEATNA